MAGIEWLDEAGSPVVEDARPATPDPDGTGDRSPATERVALALWIVALALTVAAPFQRLYAIGYLDRDSESTDGWGRYQAHYGTGSALDLHSTRYGIALVVLAAVGTGALALALTARRRASPRRAADRRNLGERVAIRAGLAVAGGLGTLTAVLLLDVDASRDNVATQARAVIGPYHPHLAVGPCIWLCAAACVCAVAALALESWARSRTRPSAPGLTPEVPAAVPDPRDEEL